jgi:hypothetical protein
LVTLLRLPDFTAREIWRTNPFHSQGNQVY